MAEIDRTSRYYGLPDLTVPGRDGTRRTLGAPRVAPAPRTRRTYQVRPGDRLDLLGLSAMGDTTRWWVLADANPWMDATRIEFAGQTIELPDA